MVAEAGNAEKFISAMFNLSNAIKSESEYCCGRLLETNDSVRYFNLHS